MLIKDYVLYCTAQKIKFSIKGFFSNCDQVHRKWQIRSDLLNKILNVKLQFLCSNILLNDRKINFAGSADHCLI